MFYKKLYFVFGWLVIVALAVLYYLFNPAKYSFFPKCPFYSLTGFNCPGCGSQRAINALLHGNLKSAAGDNFLLVASLPFLAVHFFYKIKSAYLKTDTRWAILYNPLTPKIIFCVVVLFWVFRNIPVSPFSYLAAGR